MGVCGWLAGNSLGSPLDGRSDWRNLTFYEPVIEAPVQTDSLRVVSAYTDLPVLSTAQLAKAWIESAPKTEAARFARKSLELGFRPPLSGSRSNPFAEAGSALARGAWWGLMFPGQPATAASWAWHDSTIDHSGDGVWAAACWAVAVSCAPFEPSVSACLERAVKCLPNDSRLRTIPQALGDAKRTGCTWQEARGRALNWLGEHPEHAHSTFANAFLGCLYGDADFAKSVTIAAGASGLASEQAAAVGALLGAGLGVLPPEWVKPIESSDLPSRLEKRAERAFASSEFSPFFDPVTPAVAEGDVAVPAPSVPFLDDLSALMPLYSRNLTESVASTPTLQLAVSYPDSSRDGVSLAFRIQNLGLEAVEVDPQVSGPPSWQIAFRPRRVRIEPGQSVYAPAVVKCDDRDRAGSVELDVNGVRLAAPVPPIVSWWVAAPFDNRAQLGYEREFAPETDPDPKAVFRGRSDQMIKWSELQVSGVFVDLEPHFGQAPGVAYLTSKVRFDALSVSLVVASPVGHVIWVNGERVARYQDTHAPWPKPAAPYVAELPGGGWTQILIKSLRNDDPVPPTVIYFVDSSGDLVLPTSSRMPGNPD